MKRVFRITEAFNFKKAAPGTLKFPTSTVQDPWVQKMLAMLSHASNVPVPQLMQRIAGKEQEIKMAAQLAPTLYKTMQHNAAENELFFMLCEVDIDVGGPKFNNVVFQKLIANIRGNHDEFFPLRSFIDKRPLEPKYEYVDNGLDFSSGKITTAAATPSGSFIFNMPFVQKLMDYAHIKGIKPQSKIYKSNGGRFPDEYAYLEFLIMHEFMHYSYDDFYYQKIIPKANNKIINWVGDFRSNYLLVKSGFEALPIGLYNDDINYDRQNEYIEMYRIVEAEFNKLKSDEQKMLEKLLDGLSDDHRPGQGEGEKADPTDIAKGQGSPGGDGDGEGTGDGEGQTGSSDTENQVDPSHIIDKNARRIEDAISKKKDDPNAVATHRAEKADVGASNANAGKGGKDGGGSEIDYSKVQPTFNWKQLIQKCLMSNKPKVEETYKKQNRRAGGMMEIARQMGSAAVKPGEQPMEFSEVAAAFIIDVSGSMSGVIPTIFSNITALMKTPMLKKAATIVVKYSSQFEMYKVIFGSNKAAPILDPKEKPKKWPLPAAGVFAKAAQGGTVFSAVMAGKVNSMLDQKYNVFFFFDADIFDAGNLKNFQTCLKHKPKQIFVIFDTRSNYIKARKMGMATALMTYFNGDR